MKTIALLIHIIVLLLSSASLCYICFFDTDGTDTLIQIIFSLAVVSSVCGIINYRLTTKKA